MKILSIYFALFFSLISISNTLFSQDKIDQQFQQGEIMVQLEYDTDIDYLLSDYTHVSLQNIQTISARFNIYLLTFDQSRSTNSALLNSVRSHKIVVNAQNNHFIALRDKDESMPDDLLFYTQWALNNTGQNGGTPGADIDATDAWDITTGGLTALGDTIVIAIIDGGAYLPHEDLDFWKNRAEIPNNSIDDDFNGYVDDYDGWNAYNHNGDIPNNIHGTHVSGIAGAIGNNEIGVSGVNWNAKILIVAGDSQNEATVVEALSYVYVVRERYDQTNGEEGAFVVADNCSFGVSGGDPVNYPIWEAMYDSLGQLGILSIGATDNAPVDIDSIGDIPTSFTTDFLISVTNTNNKDQLNPVAAYGDTTIDLGAPGTIIASCYPNNEYNTKTGTSMAAPQVAGAVALLMSAGDSAFMSEYKSNPEEISLLIKNAILSGVDTISDLVGKTVSGGRLNLYNSLQHFLNAPVLYVNPTSVLIDILAEATKKDTLLIKNVGNDTLIYSVTIEDQPSWISLSLTSGSLLQDESDELILSFDSDGLDTGYYHCTVVIDGNISFSQTIPVEMHVVSGVGVGEFATITSNVTVYPNPFNESVTFEFDGSGADKTMLQVYDLSGRQVFVQEQSQKNMKSSFTWNGRDANKGIYFYSITFDNTDIIAGKILKQ